MNKLKKILFGAAVLASVALLLFPVAVMLSVSLKKANDVFTIPITWIPKEFAFENYIEVFRKMNILDGFKSSIIITGLTILLILVVDIPAAY